MRLTEFKDEYAKLVNRAYGELNDKQKQTVYAMEIYRDSGDVLIACDIYADTGQMTTLNPESDTGQMTTLNPEFVDDQLRNTFQYNDTTLI